jgi:hypothetical protein
MVVAEKKLQQKLTAVIKQKLLLQRKNKVQIFELI